MISQTTKKLITRRGVVIKWHVCNHETLGERRQSVIDENRLAAASSTDQNNRVPVCHQQIEEIPEAGGFRGGDQSWEQWHVRVKLKLGHPVRPWG